MASRHELRARHTEEKQKQNPQQRFKRNMAVAALVGMTAAAAIGVFAKTYYIDNGDITIDGNDITYYDDDKNQQQGKDDNITITQHDNTTSTENTITIKADEDETVEVTIKDINIEATEKIDPDAETTKDNYEAAISIEGAGDVVLELEGDNVVKSGYDHAGVETAGSGMLTIEDENKDGSLDATGGERGAGIGGGLFGIGNVTINGGEITAKGGWDGAGIGSGEYAKKESEITINGGKITATGGRHSAGIGGAYGGNGGAYVTINGGEILAIGDDSSSGIGNGRAIDSTAYGGVTINGGTITAISNGNGAGIGGGSAQGSDEHERVIEINGGTITAIGGTESAGIGGRSHQSATVIITGGTINAVGGDKGAGIGGGYLGSASVTISGGEVTATAGKDVIGRFKDEAWMNADAIGSGGSYYWIEEDGELYLQEEAPASEVTITDGIIIEQPSGWDENGHTHNFANAVEEPCKTVETCACGSIKTTFTHIWDGGVVTKHPTTTEEGTRTYTCKTCSLTRTESIPKLAGTSASAAALTVTTLSGTAQAYEQTMADGCVIFAAPAQDAILTGSLGALTELKAQGATMLVFRTTLCETSVSIDKILAAGSADDVFALTHKGTEAVLTVAGRIIK